MNEGLGEEEHDYHFVGRAGSFCPIRPGFGGGVLLREKEGKYYAATGSKGFRWLEAEMVKAMGKEDEIDRKYYDNLVDAAVGDISEFGDFEWFISDYLDEETPIGFTETPPWCYAVDDVVDVDREKCKGCSNYYDDKHFGPSCKENRSIPF